MNCRVQTDYITRAEATLNAELNLELLARAEHHRALACDEIPREDITHIRQWIREAANVTCDSLSERVCNVTNTHSSQDHDEEWDGLYEHLSETLRDAIATELEQVTVVKTCGSCNKAHTVATWAALPLVVVADGLEVRNCGCRAGGATIAAVAS